MPLFLLSVLTNTEEYSAIKDIDGLAGNKQAA